MFKKVYPRRSHSYKTESYAKPGSKSNRFECAGIQLGARFNPREQRVRRRKRQSLTGSPLLQSPPTNLPDHRTLPTGSSSTTTRSAGTTTTGGGRGGWVGAMRRRKPVEGFLLRCCGVFAFFFWTVLVHQISTCLAIQLEERMEIVRKVLKEVPLIDGHNDLPWNIRKFLKNQLREFRFGEDLRDITPWSTSAWSHTDLRRLKEGMVAAQFWSAYAPCSSQHLDAVQLTLEQIDLIRRLVNLYPQHMALVTTADGIEESHRSGKLASLIGIEGGHSIGTSLGVLRTFYQLGARYLTLTHTCNTPWADCCKVDEPGRVPHIGGLSHFGTLVVTEMNRLGMIVDLSHVSVPTMLDALATSKAPVIFSHSSAHAICNSSRNVPDHVLKRLLLLFIA
ncbi:hypothetical protein pipiens_012758 [Culex pipiens pipiens]|uniref:Dipeptidase n=1 Tax=Culex pipiens pipiens TaxID=38569 RepID=A0ABD1D296_CULPP